MGIKEKKTKILLAIILFSDVKFNFVQLSENIQAIFDLGLNEKTKGTISGLIKEQLIEKFNDSLNNSAQNEKGINSYRLTEKGFYELCLIFPFFRYLKDKWDGKWRVLSYEIPEKKREIRDKLRREVSGWGLGPWHRSFWLTPHPIIENLRSLINQKEEEKYIQAFEAEHLVGDRDILIEKVWQKSILEKKYRDLFKIWHQTLSKSTPEPDQNKEKINKFKTVISNYVEILKIDPGLPEELVYKNWIGFEAFNIFKEIKSILLS